MVRDNLSVQKKIAIKKDEFIFHDKLTRPSINILHSGEIDVFMNFDNIEGDLDFIKDFLKKTETVKSTAFFGELYYYDNCDLNIYYKAKTDVIVSIYPIKTIDNLIKTQPDITFQIFKYLFNRYGKLLKKLDLLKDNFTDFINFYYNTLLIIKKNDISINQTNINNDLLKIPDTNENVELNKNLFLNRSNINKYLEDININLSTDKNFINSYLSIIKSEKSNFISKLKSSPEEFKQNFLKMADIICKQLNKIKYIYTIYSNKLNILFEKEKGIFNPLLDFLLNGASFVHINYKQELLNYLKSFINSSYDFLKDFFGYEKTDMEFILNKIPEESVENPDVDTDGILDFLDDDVFSVSSKKEDTNISKPPVFNNILDKILNYSKINNEEKILFKELVEKFKKLEDKENLNSESRKIRKEINKIYINIFTNTVIKKFKEKNPQPYINYFLQYGIIDETMFKDETLFYINKLPPIPKLNIPIVFLHDWLHLIYTGKEIPSINELGIDFNKFLREKYKRMSYKEKLDFDGMSDEDKKKYNVTYEMENIISYIIRLLSGRPSSSFNFTFEEELESDINKIFVNARKLEAILNEILTYDYSLFSRETLYKISSTRNEIVMKEVKPYFILIPVAGERIMAWQELSGANKLSRGRIFLPVFFKGDLKKALIYAMGNYKWELNRNMRGASWADPVNGGLTGAFYDYISFYKKNSKLSDEAKDKIKKVIADNRKDIKKIFTEYYYQWISYEAKGIMKLDRVAREIFFKHCPFPKNIRTKLSRIPIYNELNRKFNIVNQRHLDRLNNKYKKLRDENGKLPEDLENNLNFYER